MNVVVGFADGNGEQTFRLFAEAAIVGHKLLPTPRQLDLLKVEVNTFVRYTKAYMQDLREMLQSHAEVGEEVYCVEEIFDCGWKGVIDRMWLVAAFEHWTCWLYAEREAYQRLTGALPEEVLLDSVFGDHISIPAEELEALWSGILEEFGPVGVVINYLENITQLIQLNCDADVGENAIFWQTLMNSVGARPEQCVRYVAAPLAD